MTQQTNRDPGVHVLSHPLAMRALGELRDKTTSTIRFRQQAHELAKYLILEATRDLPLEDVTIETPLGPTTVQQLKDRPLVVAAILRAGLAMVQSAMELLPEAEIRHIGLRRDEETLQPVSYYLKLPERYPKETTVLILDPMLATGGSAAAAIDLFKQRGVTNIKFLCLISSPEGVKHVRTTHPDVPIFAVSIDSHLNEKGYIIPGLGDAGDRMFCTE